MSKAVIFLYVIRQLKSLEKSVASVTVQTKGELHLFSRKKLSSCQTLKIWVSISMSLFSSVTLHFDRVLMLCHLQQLFQ